MRMNRGPTRPETASFAGSLALAVAMGIGRFAFTPILPMMQEDLGLTLQQGSWLASANYAGYLLGALYSIGSGLGEQRAVAAGLLTTSFATLAAAAALDSLGTLIALRFVAGFGSALVLVHISAWALQILARAGRPALGGALFSGVGLGIVLAGGTCLALGERPAPSAMAWFLLGLAALLAGAWIWPVVRSNPSEMNPRTGAVAGLQPSRPRLASHWRLIYAHGAFGFGYIIPATFLPVMAKQAVADVRLFGWAWPVFGAAAAVSTLLAAKLTARFDLRRSWSCGLLLMAFGVTGPLTMPGITGIIASALAVGGTFMVVTMLGMQEARRASGGDGRSLMAAMTSAFALGQIAGPLLAAECAHVPGGFSLAMVAAALALAVASFLLYRAPPAAAAPSPSTPPWSEHGS